MSRQRQTLKGSRRELSHGNEETEHTVESVYVAYSGDSGQSGGSSGHSGQLLVEKESIRHDDSANEIADTTYNELRESLLDY